jgi:acid phosphatase
MRNCFALLLTCLTLTACHSGEADCSGGCPSGDTCSTANGAPVCRAPSGIPRLTNVFVILMENTSLSTLQASSGTPFLTGLQSTAATSSNYHGVAHPSLPNYVALTSGGTQGISCDCNPTGSSCTSLTCNSLLGACGCAPAAMNLGDVLEAASKTWRAYGEDMGSPCNLSSSGNYATRHVPFLYYDDVQSNSTRCAVHVVDYAAAFASDLAGATPTFAFIAPNLIDDMHDPYPATATNLTNGDTWLSKNVPPILASAAYKSGGAVIIVWDEDDLSGLIDADAPIPIFILSPFARAGYSSSAHADHYALLATIGDALGVARLGSSAQATPLVDLFAAQ